jgi:regulatory protein
MGTITALRLKARTKQINVFVDGLFALSIANELAVTNHLEVGRSLSVDQIEELQKADLSRNCMEAAVHYLSYRPRSEHEVRQRLRRRGFDSKTIEEVVTKLKESSLIDDVAFSEYWRNNRTAFSPRSARLINLELRQKGVAKETANEAVTGLNDENSVYEAGLRKARRLTALDHDDFRSRLYDYLIRRGFSYEKIRHAIDRLWQEIHSGSSV